MPKYMAGKYFSIKYRKIVREVFPDDGSEAGARVSAVEVGIRVGRRRLAHSGNQNARGQRARGCARSAARAGRRARAVGFGREMTRRGGGEGTRKRRKGPYAERCGDSASAGRAGTEQASPLLCAVGGENDCVALRVQVGTTPPFAQHVASTWTRDIYYMSSKTGSQTGARLMWPPGGQQTWKQLQEKILIFFTPGNRMCIRDRMDAVRTKYILGNRKTRVSGRHNSQYELERNQRSILRVLSSGWLLARGNGDAREAKSSREAARPDLRLMGDEITELPELQKLEGYLENVLREGLRRA
ncbi:hypothetical protein C8J57DRAFT_1458452 [Mycena rebaudengoi]|nr:hypothetical protein C8J57DRAFT_1458452 [Mycena rebaudengoi]